MKFKKKQPLEEIQEIYELCMDVNHYLKEQLKISEEKRRLAEEVVRQFVLEDEEKEEFKALSEWCYKCNSFYCFNEHHLKRKFIKKNKLRV